MGMVIFSREEEQKERARWPGSSQGRAKIDLAYGNSAKVLWVVKSKRGAAVSEFCVLLAAAAGHTHFSQPFAHNPDLTTKHTGFPLTLLGLEPISERNFLVPFPEIYSIDPFPQKNMP